MKLFALFVSVLVVQAFAVDVPVVESSTPQHGGVHQVHKDKVKPQHTISHLVTHVQMQHRPVSNVAVGGGVHATDAVGQVPTVSGVHHVPNVHVNQVPHVGGQHVPVVVNHGQVVHGVPGVVPHHVGVQQVPHVGHQVPGSQVVHGVPEVVPHHVGVQQVPHAGHQVPGSQVVQVPVAQGVGHPVGVVQVPHVQTASRHVENVPQVPGAVASHQHHQVVVHHEGGAHSAVVPQNVIDKIHQVEQHVQQVMHQAHHHIPQVINHAINEKNKLNAAGHHASTTVKPHNV